jgi:hypothetical protein
MAHSHHQIPQEIADETSKNIDVTNDNDSQNNFTIHPRNKQKIHFHFGAFYAFHFNCGSFNRAIH